MSRIDDLISKFCPDGVEFSSLGTLLDYEQPSKYLVKSTSYNEKFHTPVLTAGQTFILGYTDEVEGVYPASPTHPVIIFDDFTTAFKWVDFPFKAKSSAMKMLTLKANTPALLRFLYYLMQGIRYTPQDHARQWIGIYSGFRVPVPPLEVQQEIVHILDQFTQLEAGLKAELEARRRQYEFYRTKILMPDAGWRTTSLGDIADIFDGPHATPKKTSSGPWYLSISSLKDGNVDIDASAHLASEDYAKWTRRVAPCQGDTLFSYETRIGQAAYWDRTDPAALGRRMGLLRPKESLVVPKFLTIAYLSPGFQEMIKTKTVRGSTVDRIPIADMSSWPISIPSITEQQIIIALLDEFDTLVNDLTVGLPAELAARRKQYEYYRDRLLRFEEAAV